VTFRGGREREVDGKSLSSVEGLAAENDLGHKQQRGYS